MADILDPATVRRAARALRQRLEALERAGVSHLGRPPADVAAVMVSSSVVSGSATSSSAASPGSALPANPRPAPSQPSRAAAPTPSAPPAPVPKPAAAKAPAPVTAPAAAAPGVPLAQLPDLANAERTSRLAVLQTQVSGCTKCRELSSLRNKTVFGVGNVRSRLLFCGEAPGADEDKQGEPFVGAAGQLLTKIIQACTLQRGDVYILNTLKCRPPGNRVPNPDELDNCRGYLEGQLEILRPEYICALGATAARALLDTNVSIGKLRGKFHAYRGTPVLCTYHPSYLLRNPSAKADVWKDMQFLMDAMGIELPKK